MIQVGQKLYRWKKGRYNEVGEVKEYEVLSVARKYITLDNGDKVTIQNLRHENKVYSQCEYQLYLSAQEILDNNEREHLFNNIGILFKNYNVPDCLTLPILRTISNIIEGNK